MWEEGGLIKMLKKIYVPMGCLVTIVTMAGFTQYRQSSPTNDEAAYYQTAIIKGTVTILNHPTLGKTSGNNTFLVFQRADCKQSVIGIRTDVNGNYQIHVSPGRYRLIVREGKIEKETKDVLAPNQQRLINVGQPGTITNFDIDILLPKG